MLLLLLTVASAMCLRQLADDSGSLFSLLMAKKQVTCRNHSRVWRTSNHRIHQSNKRATMMMKRGWQATCMQIAEARR